MLPPDRYGYDLAMQSESMELLARPDVKFRWVSLSVGKHDARVMNEKLSPSCAKRSFGKDSFNM